MRCPHCSNKEDKVIESRTIKDGDVIRRRRECFGCGRRYTTYEEVVRSDLFVIKNDGCREEFTPSNIRKGIELACWKRKISSEELDEMQQQCVQRITEKYEDEVKSSDIGAVVMEVLKEHDHIAYIRFASIYRNFTDAEDFISEVNGVANKIRENGNTK
ncbi:MAG: transcriptional regulator NrdR [Lentisphaeria bacterium]